MLLVVLVVLGPSTLVLLFALVVSRAAANCEPEHALAVLSPAALSSAVLEPPGGPPGSGPWAEPCRRRDDSGARAARCSTGPVDSAPGAFGGRRMLRRIAAQTCETRRHTRASRDVTA